MPKRRPWLGNMEDSEIDSNVVNLGVETNQEKTKDNQETNWRQTGDKSKEIWRQSKDTAETLQTPNEDKIETHLKTNYRQSEDTTKDKINRLSGVKYSALIYIMHICLQEGTRITPKIAMDSIKKALNSNITTIKKTIQRLTKEDLLIRKSYKNGRGGWTIYELPEEVYKELYLLSNRTNWRQNEDKLETHLETQPKTSTLSSSSHIFNNTTTDTTLPKEWNEIDISPIKSVFKSESSQFFGIKQLKSIYNQVGHILSAKQVEDSIKEFSYGYFHYRDTQPYCTMRNPCAILFNHLKEGETWHEPRYLSPEENQLKTVYDNICNKLETEKQQYFKKWYKDNKEHKYQQHSKDKKNKNQMLTNGEFQDLMEQEFETKVWPDYKFKLILEYLGQDKATLIEKFQKIDSAKNS